MFIQIICKDIFGLLTGPLPQGGSYPAGIWCENDVGSTSMRRHHVASTLIRRHSGTKCPLGICLNGDLTSHWFGLETNLDKEKNHLVSPRVDVFVDFYLSGLPTSDTCRRFNRSQFKYFSSSNDFIGISRTNSAGYSRSNLLITYSI